MRPDFNRGVFYKMTEGKRGGAVFYWKMELLILALHILIIFNTTAYFVENHRFGKKIKNKSTKKAKKNIKNLSVQLQLLTFATPT